MGPPPKVARAKPRVCGDDRRNSGVALGLALALLLAALLILPPISLEGVAGTAKAAVAAVESRVGGRGDGACAGPAPGAACPPAALVHANAAIAPLLAELVGTPFFRYFKVSLTCDCPFWKEYGSCSLRDCSVCECESGEVPPALTTPEAAGGAPAELASCGRLGGDPAGAVDAALPPAVRARLVAIAGWRGFDNPWMAGPPVGRADDEYAYIDLTKNPERYTGYAGPPARRVWDFIYSQACFEPDGEGVGGRGGARPAPGQCAPGGDLAARRAYWRLLSGVHASITCHIAADYLLDDGARAWGPNLGLFADRLTGPKAWRVGNLHYAYALVARAVRSAGPLLASADLGAGSAAGGGEREAELVAALLASRELAAVCGGPAHDAAPLAGALAAGGLQAAFRNVTAAMDCVGCEKCKVWGKLQLLGVATALKVLAAEAGAAVGGAGGPPPRHPAPTPPAPLTLERNEVVALVNLFDRLARSVATAADMQGRLAAGEVPSPVVRVADHGAASRARAGLAGAVGF